MHPNVSIRWSIGPLVLQFLICLSCHANIKSYVSIRWSVTTHACMNAHTCAYLYELSMVRTSTNTVNDVIMREREREREKERESESFSLLSSSWEFWPGLFHSSSCCSSSDKIIDLSNPWVTWLVLRQALVNIGLDCFFCRIPIGYYSDTKILGPVLRASICYLTGS